MASVPDLLRDVHTIADPCEKLRQGFSEIASDNSTDPELRQAAADLADAIEHVFRVARYIADKSGKE
ncbi:hypothetical protein GGQ73_004421 [Rhizobium skierniewicense]|uniref:Uncharacterized protein n=1 Tax=Rhizobium skierniewicense TaxID=984260 RepID=A0A7W6CFF1_9HYPH|nr:hypothetical protein [Rhizobium skierniewicense]MBB3948434.1 hypothetical protein [Rhizobium skierniewicense]